MELSITNTTTGKKDKPIKINLGEWCRLCDEIGVPPDANMELIIKAAKIKEDLLTKYLAEINRLKKRAECGKCNGSGTTIDRHGVGKICSH